MIAAVSKSPDDTRDLAAAVSTVVSPGDVILLDGELGAGKTTFAQGFGRALGVAAPVTSPTFTLVRVQACRAGNVQTFVHADLYRLDSLGEVADLGIGELVDGGGVALVEWGGAAAEVLGRDHLAIRMEIGDTEHVRLVELTTVGTPWRSRQSRLTEVLDRWRPGA